MENAGISVDMTILRSDNQPLMNRFLEIPEIGNRSELGKELEQIDSISLSEMNEVRLLNRFDSKYCFNKRELGDILREISDDYFVLEVDGTRIQSYKTIYYDTPGDRFYLDHHNGYSNRIKLRKRAYLNSDLVFLEVKRKNNKGKTSKKRMQIEEFRANLGHEENSFVQRNADLNGDLLEVKYGNMFKRITLVSKDLKERCTIDTDLIFDSFDVKTHRFNEMVIAELKQERVGQRSKLAEVLRSHKIYRQGFSKYCMGRAMNEKGLKTNLFKAELLKIKKHFG